MAEETALLDREDTGVSLPSQELDAPENDGDGESPETVAAESETENDEPEQYSREEFDRRLKAELAKKEESYRQKLEHEKGVAAAKAEQDAYESRKKEANEVRNGRAFQELGTYVQWGVQNGKLPPAEWLRKTADALSAMAFIDQHEAYTAQVDKFLRTEYPDYRVPRELAGEVERVVTKGDPEAMVNVHQKIMRAAILEAERPKLRKEIEAQLRQKSEDRDLEERDTQRATEPRPTRGGSSIGGGKPLVLTTAEINAYPSSQWMRDYTAEERQKIYANTQEADSKHGAGTVRNAVKSRWGK